MIDNKWLMKNKGKLIGTSIAFLLGLIFLFFGFWKMIFVTLLLVAGFVIGHQLDRNTDMKQLLDSIQLDKWMRK